MSDCISREDAKNYVIGRYDDQLGFITMEDIIDQLDYVPAADVRPVVRGKWIIHKPFDSGRHNCNECIECSVCGTWFGHDCYEISNFCPNCGADMREEATP